MTPAFMRRTLEIIANAFPVWVLAACGMALVQPAWFAWFRGDAIVAALAVIMLGMGLTLAIDDFGRVASRPLLRLRCSRCGLGCPMRRIWRRMTTTPLAPQPTSFPWPAE